MEKSKQGGKAKAGKRIEQKAPKRREGGDLKILRGSQSKKQREEGKSRKKK